MRIASTRSAAAPGAVQDARTRPVPNHTAPVETRSCAAVEPVDGDAAARRPVFVRRDGVDTCIPYLFVITGGSASGAGAAGMAGSAGAGRPGSFEVPSL
jgi:hypothetical protein